MKKKWEGEHRNTVLQFQWEQLSSLLAIAQQIARGFQPRDEEIVDLIEHIQKANVTAHGVVAGEEVYYIPIRWEENPHFAPGVEAQEKQVRRLFTGGHGSPRP